MAEHLHPHSNALGFMGGLLALGAYTDPLGLDSPRAQRDLKTGRVCIVACLRLLTSFALDSIHCLIRCSGSI